MKLDINNPLYVLGFTAAVSAAFAAAITTLQVAAAPRVRRNEALREERALAAVFALGDPATMAAAEVADTVRQRVERAPAVRDPETGRAFAVFRAYRTAAEPGTPRDPGSLEAIAFRFSGSGFWARITGLLALSPDLARVKGLVFEDQSETPGLGGRIMEKEFVDKFRGLDVSPPAQGERFIYVGGGLPAGPQDPRSGRHVDAITGATQTSLAIGKFLDENLRQFRRAIAAQDSSGARPREASQQVASREKGQRSCHSEPRPPLGGRERRTSTDWAGAHPDWLAVQRAGGRDSSLPPPGGGPRSE